MSLRQTVSMLYQNSAVSIGELVLDVALEETHARQARITEHPVESGCTIADHIQALPESVQLEGVISNTPLSFLGLPIFDTREWVQEAFKKLEELFQSGQTVDIVTTLKTYTAMALESLSIHRNAHNSEALRFTCCAKAIRKADSVVIQIPKPKVKRAQPKKSLGKQPATPAPEAVAKKAQSLLSSFFQ